MIIANNSVKEIQKSMFRVVSIAWMVYFVFLLILLTSTTGDIFIPLGCPLAKWRAIWKGILFFEKCDRADGFLTACHLWLLVNTGN